jgi:hypothetical protein
MSQSAMIGSAAEALLLHLGYVVTIINAWPE